jgi:hypothetical protein
MMARVHVEDHYVNIAAHIAKLRTYSTGVLLLLPSYLHNRSIKDQTITA